MSVDRGMRNANWLKLSLEMGQIYFTQPWKQERDSVSMDIKEIFQKEGVWMLGVANQNCSQHLPQSDTIISTMFTVDFM